MAGVLGLGSSLRGLRERETRKRSGCRVLDGGPICMFSSVVVEVAYLRTPWIERNEMHAQFQAIMCLLSNSDRHYVSSWTILLQISCNVNTGVTNLLRFALCYVVRSTASLWRERVLCSIVRMSLHFKSSLCLYQNKSLSSLAYAYR